MSDHAETPSNVARRALLGGAALATLAAYAAGPAQAADGQVYVIAELTAKPGSETALRELMVPFAEGARNEPGCVHYTLMEVTDEPGRFLTYEIWRDKAAIDAHMVTPQIKAAGAKLATVLGKPFTQIFLNGLT